MSDIEIYYLNIALNKDLKKQSEEHDKMIEKLGFNARDTVEVSQ